jgi:hypothetical protein
MPHLWKAPADVMDEGGYEDHGEQSRCANSTVLLYAYLMPTFHPHTTHWGIVNQSDVGESGKLRFSSVKVQETAAQTAFEQAFILLMQMMSALSGSFDLNMGKQLEEHGQNWVKAFE